MIYVENSMTVIREHLIRNFQFKMQLRTQDFDNSYRSESEFLDEKSFSPFSFSELPLQVTSGF